MLELTQRHSLFDIVWKHYPKEHISDKKNQENSIKYTDGLSSDYNSQ